jgi:Spx/MgsR family transcriptional regulator
VKKSSKNSNIIKPSNKGGLVKLYGLPHCDATKAVIKWLTDKNIESTLHNYKAEGISKEKLQEWSKRLGWEKLLNKRSTTWRSLSTTVQDKIVNENVAIEAMLKNTSLIKRPVIEFGNELIIGFDEKKLSATFK